MQSEDVRVHVLIPRLKSIFKQLCRNFMKREAFDDKPINSINLLENHLPIMEIYCGTESEILYNSNKLRETDIQSFKNHTKLFYITFLQDIRKRFDFDDVFLNGIQNFSQSAVLDGRVNSIVQFILKFFSNEHKNIELINNEYRALADCEYLKKNEKCFHIRVLGKNWSS